MRLLALPCAVRLLILLVLHPLYLKAARVGNRHTLGGLFFSGRPFMRLAGILVRRLFGACQCGDGFSAAKSGGFLRSA